MEKPASPPLHTAIATLLSALLVVAGARALRMGFKTWGDLGSFEFRSVAGSLGLYVAGFALLVAAISGPPDAVLDRLVPLGESIRSSVQRLPSSVRVAFRFANTWGPVIAVVSIIGRRIYLRWGVDYFGTDGLLFAQYAVDSLLEGKNPYAVTMVDAFDRYPTTGLVGTYRIDGTVVAELSYPAMSVLAFVPQKLIGIPCLDITSLVVLAIVCVWLVLRAPLLVKWAAPAILWAEWSIVSFTAGGVFDILWTLPLLASMVAFARRRLPIAGAMFGIACSVKQTPWFCAPFLLIWLWEEADSVAAWLRQSLRLGGSALAAFLFINGPFMVVGFGAWLRGVLVPVAGGAPLVELGTGPIMFNVAGITHAPKAFFMVLMAVAFLLIAVAYAQWFARVKWLAWGAPMLVLWFNYRSLHNYYVFLLPVVLMSVYLRCEDTRVVAPRKHPGLFFALSCAVACGVLVVAFVKLSPRTALPVHAAISDRRDPGALGRISEMVVDVSNEGTTAITPTFGVVYTGSQTPLDWTVQSGPEQLGPGASGQYELTPPVPSGTVPYDAAIHLRVYDRGTERRASVFEEPVGERLAPAIRNHAFQHTTISSENGLPQPLSWTVRVTPELTSLEQVIERPFTEIALGASIGSQTHDLRKPIAGFELRGRDHCIVGAFTPQNTKTVEDAKLNGRECRVIGIPSSLERHLEVVLPLRQIVGAEFYAHFFEDKRSTRLILFGPHTYFDDVSGR